MWDMPVVLNMNYALVYARIWFYTALGTASMLVVCDEIACDVQLCFKSERCRGISIKSQIFVVNE